MRNGSCGATQDSPGAEEMPLPIATYSFLNETQKRERNKMNTSVADSFVQVSYEEELFILLWMDLCETQRPEAEVVDVASN